MYREAKADDAARGRPNFVYSEEALDLCKLDKDGLPSDKHIRKDSPRFAEKNFEVHVKFLEYFDEQLNKNVAEKTARLFTLKKTQPYLYYLRKELHRTSDEDEEPGRVIKSDNPDTDDELCKNDLWDESALVLCPPLASYIMVGQPT